MAAGGHVERQFRARALRDQRQGDKVHDEGDQRAKGPAFAHAVIPAHEFADQHDADTQRPDMDGTQHFQKIDRLRGGAGAHGDIGHGLFSRLGGE